MARKRFQPRFVWDQGQVVVNFAEHEREMLNHLLDQLRQIVTVDEDPALHPLKPAAHPNDPAAEEQFRELIGNDLQRSRLDALDLVIDGLERSSSDNGGLDDGAVSAWMQSINALRILLGQRLEIDATEHHEIDQLNDEQRGLFELFEWSGWLLEQLVSASTAGLDQHRTNPQ